LHAEASDIPKSFSKSKRSVVESSGRQIEITISDRLSLTIKLNLWCYKLGGSNDRVANLLSQIPKAIIVLTH